VRIHISIAAVIFPGYTLQAGAEDFDPENFALNYLEAWAATQSPNATKDDIEHYLSFLAEDVGHEHIPHDTDDTRYPDGKESMRGRAQSLFWCTSAIHSNLGSVAQMKTPTDL
jgi:hypothetical protein